MGKVIALPPSRKIANTKSEGATAEILFFTGVRYHRMSEEEFATLVAPAQQRRANTKTGTTKTSATKATKTAVTTTPGRKLA